jgi:hypothetical protein
MQICRILLLFIFLLNVNIFAQNIQTELQGIFNKYKTYGNVGGGYLQRQSKF